MADLLQLDFPTMVDYEVEIGERVRAALHGKGPFQLTIEQRAILNTLWHHRGADNAIPLANLRARLKADGHAVTGRTIKKFIQSLVRDFKIKVAARRQQPWGYFLPRQHDEIASTALIYEHEIEELAKRVGALMGTSHAMDVLTKVRDQMLQEQQP